jgi:hypothetical protein
MPELVDAGGGGEARKEFEVEAAGGDNEGIRGRRVLPCR